MVDTKKNIYTTEIVHFISNLGLKTDHIDKFIVLNQIEGIKHLLPLPNKKQD